MVAWFWLGIAGLDLSFTGRGGGEHWRESEQVMRLGEDKTLGSPVHWVISASSGHVHDKVVVMESHKSTSPRPCR